MNHLPIEKQLTHLAFCQQIADIKDVNVIKEMLKDLYLKYLSDQHAVVKIARNDFWRE